MKCTFRTICTQNLTHNNVVNALSIYNSEVDTHHANVILIVEMMRCNFYIYIQSISIFTVACVRLLNISRISAHPSGKTVNFIQCRFQMYIWCFFKQKQNVKENRLPLTFAPSLDLWNVQNRLPPTTIKDRT